MTPSEIAARPQMLDANVAKDLHAADGMARARTEQSLNHYFDCGREAVARICEVLVAGRVAAPKSILDFGCGFGRVARYLRSAFPGSALYVTDINREGLDFTAEKFSGRAVHSDGSLDNFNLPEQVELIWCGSVLTHLAEQEGRSLMELFHRTLSPGGMVVFTVHGRHVANAWKRGKWPYKIDADQMKSLHDSYYQSQYACAEQGRRKGYGVSITPINWIVERIWDFEDMRLVAYIERGWDNHQDVVAMVKRN